MAEKAAIHEITVRDQKVKLGPNDLMLTTAESPTIIVADRDVMKRSVLVAGLIEQMLEESEEKIKEQNAPVLEEIQEKTKAGNLSEAERQKLEKKLLPLNAYEGKENPDEEIVPLFKITTPVFKKCYEWMVHHKNDPLTSHDDDSDSRKKSTDIEEWDQKYMQVDQEMLFEIILGANFLDVKALLDIGCKTVANMIKGKSPEEIRKTFNIQNDFTPEEEDQIRRENEWAEDR